MATGKFGTWVFTVPGNPNGTQYRLVILENRGHQLYEGTKRLISTPVTLSVLAELAHKAAHHDFDSRILENQEIIKAVWGDSASGTTDTNLHQQIRKLRKVFGDAPEASRVIETIGKGNGYRFVPDVNFQQGSASPENQQGLNAYRREIHHYHLTLNPERKPVWLYTIIDFSKSPAGGTLRAVAPLILNAEEEYAFEWEAQLFGFHLLIKLKRGMQDVGIEMFPFATNSKSGLRLAGVRINDAWPAKPTVTDSIAIISVRPLAGLEKISIGPVPSERSRDLHRIWASLNSGLVRLPEVDFNEEEAQRKQASPSLERFWKKYLEDDLSRKRVLYYGKPLFSRDQEHRVFHREVGKDEERDYAIPCYSFLNSGEVHCMLKLLRWFDSQGVLLEEHGKNHGASIGSITNEQEREAHGILLGAPAVNGMVHSFQQEEDLPFKVRTTGISRRTGKGKDEWELQYPDQDLGEQTEAHALVSRMPGKHRRRDTVVTVISSHIGRAIQGLGEALTTEERVAEYQQKVEVADQWPEKFQLVFKVILGDNETVPSEPELIDWWPRKDKRTN